MIQPITIKQAGAPDLSGDRTRPNVLVIAGYDQSGGAGVLADVKTLEAHGIYGYAVCTGMTFQNERTITKVQWFTEKEIFEQIDLCCQSARFDWVKIGICRSVTMIGSILRHLREHNPAIKIILDPVIRASSGKDFWEGADREAVLQWNDSLFVKTNCRFVKIPLSSLLYVSAENNYIHLVTSERKYVLRLSLNQFMEKVCWNRLVRIHRSHLVNTDAIQSFAEQEVTVGKEILPVGKQYKEAFWQQFGFR